MPQSPSQEWFSDHAWNAAIAAAEEQHWQAAAVLFGSSAQYQAASASPTAAQLQKQMVRHCPCPDATVVEPFFGVG